MWRHYRDVAGIRTMAASDVGRGSETLMTFVKGDLFRVARRFASGASRKALVVTGFYIPQAQRPAAESDGPVGAVELCAAMRAMGGDAWLVSDAWCAPVVDAAAEGVLPSDHVLIAPRDEHFAGWLESIRHLIGEQSVDTAIFIERVGPALDGIPRNMRGVDILQWTAPLSRLASLGLHTIGIGDGGNEIGMGRIANFAIEGAVTDGGRIACAVATRELIVAGTSNWGGHALVCALYSLGCHQVATLLDEAWHRDTLARVAAAGGLDGVTLLNTPTVDGLSESRYYSQIRAMSERAMPKRVIADRARSRRHR
ncbi:glutamate cyclase domain-containing protein [Bifidobacterium sp.]|jgi:hypothetical protein|uniref:glutamate cyclase domain-containing protein n=1 Tax=Bifidobacterium sp. TaxID=41200 RepID=UPI0025BDBC74|nr:glutamate cyclase domain-containing protein [Bifidobacterium sp.]MCH4209325.1 DUF4392 domain-containing protein [Bifidobacterium sp.]MCI1224119.1 DUF4392 domain-containing protein [Bifidobacterium sp.]